MPEEKAGETQAPVNVTSEAVMQVEATMIPEVQVQVEPTPTQVEPTLIPAEPTQVPVSVIAEETDKIDDDNKDGVKEVIAEKTYSYYLVKPGDTLGKISEQIYNSVYYVNEIKKLNKIDNEDAIYAGQKLWLPDK